MGAREEGNKKVGLKAAGEGFPAGAGPAGGNGRVPASGMEERDETKKICRVCGRMVTFRYRGSGGRICMSCLHRTHADHLAGNRRVCLRCAGEDLFIPPEYNRVPRSITLVHLADLHLGGDESVERAELLKKWLEGGGWNYILVSGDLTGRAERKEYERAARWIRDVESTGARVAVVPGNHDIGYWGNAASVAGQAVGKKYHRWIKKIDRPIEPCLRGPGCVVLGLNSSHGINPARLFNGYLDRWQRARAVEILRSTPQDHLKVVFCHHPLVRFPENRHRAMFRAEVVREELAAAGANLFLWGHQHSFAAADLAGAWGRCYAVQSPTLSNRLRNGEHPGFTVVEWFLKERVVIRAFNIVKAGYIEEEKRAEYPVQGGTAQPFVE